MAEELSRQGRTPDRGRSASPSRRELPAPLVRFVWVGWPYLWIALFVVGQWQAGLVLLMMTAPVMALVRGPRGSVRRQMHRDRHRAERRELYDRRVLEREQRRQGRAMHPRPAAARAHEGSAPSGPADPSAPAAPSTSEPAAAERSLAAAVARARTGASPLDPDAIALVDELDAVLRPMLVRARGGGVDAAVRRDLESIALDHLPEALRAYQQLPPRYAHEHRTADGRTPAEELRSQLALLVQGCGPLRDAVHGADVARQRELGRFLEAKFRRSDLDL